MRFLHYMFIFVLITCYCEVILADGPISSSTDAGTLTTTAGTPTTTAGTPTTTAGTAATNAGTGATNAGTAATNAGTGATSAGTVTTTIATSSTPVTTSTEAPLVLTKLPISNTFVYPTNGARGLLQNILVLRNQVLQLTKELQNLSQDVDPTSSPLFSQIDELSNNASAMNQTIDDLQQRLNTLSQTEEVLNKNATVIQSYFTCLSKSPCVTEAATSPLPSTALPLSSCPPPPPTATDSSQDYEQNDLSNVNCSSIIGSGKMDLTIASVTIAGTSCLTITDGESGATLANISATISEATNISGASFIIYYRADKTSSISFKLSYEKQNLCADADAEQMCGDNGKCQVGNGKAYCVCNACWSGEKCSSQQTACSQREKNKCKDPTPNCKMAPSEDNQTCVAQCVAEQSSIAAWVRKLYR